MSDLRRALLGLHVGDEFEPGQTVFALCGAVPLPARPEELSPEVLDPRINAADTGGGGMLIVTDDFVIYCVDDSTTRVMKSFVFTYAPLPNAIVDLLDELVDDEDYVRRWPKDQIVSAGTYRYEYQTRGLFGAKVVPLFYHMFSDTTGTSYVFLQPHIGRAPQLAERMGAQLEVMAG